MSDKGTILGHLAPIQHDADGIEYDNTSSGLTATELQSAVDELKTDIDGKEPTLPLTTRGDLLYRNSSNVTARLPIGSADQVLSSDGTDVSWQDASAGATRETIIASGSDSSDINTAISAMNTLGGGTIRLDGLIDMDGDINMASNVKLRGYGPGTGLRNNTSSSYEVKFVGTTPTYYAINGPIANQTYIVCDTAAQASNFTAGTPIIVKDNAGTTAACWTDKVHTAGNPSTGTVVTYGAVFNPGTFTASASAAPLTAPIENASIENMDVKNTSTGSIKINVQYAVHVNISFTDFYECTLELDQSIDITTFRCRFNVEDSTSHARHIALKDWLGSINIENCYIANATTAIESIGTNSCFYKLSILNNNITQNKTSLDFVASGGYGKSGMNVGQIIGNTMTASHTGTYAVFSFCRWIGVKFESNIIEGANATCYISGYSGFMTECILANNRVDSTLTMIYAYRCMIANNNAGAITFSAGLECTMIANNSYSTMSINHANIYGPRENVVKGNMVRGSFYVIGTSTYKAQRNIIQGNIADAFFLYDYSEDALISDNIFQGNCTITNSSGDTALRTIFSNNKVFGSVTWTEANQDYCVQIGNCTDGTITDLTTGGGTGNIQANNTEF